jgi:hypothetical protein
MQKLVLILALIWVSLNGAISNTSKLSFVLLKDSYQIENNNFVN